MAWFVPLAVIGGGAVLTYLGVKTGNSVLVDVDRLGDLAVAAVAGYVAHDLAGKGTAGKVVGVAAAAGVYGAARRWRGAG